MEKDLVKLKISGVDNSTSSEIEITVEGESQITFWNDDLKVKAILTLLGSIDYKNYHETSNEHLIDDHFNEIIKLAKISYGKDY